MAHNEHLLDNFGACKETRTLAGKLLREAKVKTAAGSGHEIGVLSTGLPAVCILIASERLNNGDVTKKAAQAAACLRPKDFSKVYTQVQAALETTSIQSPSFRLGRKNAPIRELPSKDSPQTRQASDLRKRRSRDVLDIERPLPETPTKKRKTDLSSSSAVLSKPPNPLSTTSIQSSPSFRLGRKNEPVRELPSKDSPQTRQASDLRKRRPSDVLETERPLPETPTKKRKADLSLSPAVLSKPPTPLSSRASTRVTPVRRPETATPSINVPSSPLKQSLPVTNTTLDLPSSSEESDVDDLPPPRRFRPVYLDYKQWNARDPRLARVWKKAEMHKQALIQECGHPLDSYS